MSVVVVSISCDECLVELLDKSFSVRVWVSLGSAPSRLVQHNLAVGRCCRLSVVVRDITPHTSDPGHKTFG